MQMQSRQGLSLPSGTKRKSISGCSVLFSRILRPQPTVRQCQVPSNSCLATAACAWTDRDASCCAPVAHAVLGADELSGVHEGSAAGLLALRAAGGDADHPAARVVPQPAARVGRAPAALGGEVPAGRHSSGQAILMYGLLTTSWTQALAES